MSQSFELRPQMAPSPFAGGINSIVWTYPREDVPPVLARQGISSSTWSKTHDGLSELYEIQMHQAQQMRGKIWFALIPCAMPFVMKNTMQVARDIHAQWNELLREQSDIYRRYGVQVTLAMQMQSRGFGSSRHLEMHPVGLRFEIVDQPATMAPSAYVPTTMATGYGGQMNNAAANNANLAGRLENLNNLYGAGVISFEEYEDTKTRILQAV